LIAKEYSPIGRYEEKPAKKGDPPTVIAYQGFDGEQTFQATC
jgi:hypothetical protein